MGLSQGHDSMMSVFSKPFFLTDLQFIYQNFTGPGFRDISPYSSKMMGSFRVFILEERKRYCFTSRSKIHPHATATSDSVISTITASDKAICCVRSEAGVPFPAQPQVGKLLVACRWSAVYSTEP